MKLVVTNFGYSAGGWRVDRHPRYLADLTGDGRADIVGFGDGGVWVSLNNGNGTFAAPQLVVANFGYSAGGWRVDRHPRYLADLTGDGRADIVGFGDGGVWVSLNNGNGTFARTYVRQNIWDLQANTPWDPVTLAYANAIKALQARALTDPTSWTYQAAMHGRSGPVPPGAVWNQCQHGSWYFLPWHRLYLYYFELIIRAEVIAQGGPEDWALPYWNYENPGQAALPPAFRQPTMPDGTANPLFVTQRSPGWNTGSQLPPSVTTSVAALNFTVFTPPPAPGFGGGRTTPQQFFGAPGELEFTPHNDVHSLIGGFMGNAFLAALDPIFWLHHANIDRLWVVWLSRGGGRADPPDAPWRTQPFVFHDETGAQVSLNVDEGLDTAGQLGYRYEGVAGAALLLDEAAAAMSESLSPGRSPEFVGGSERSVDLVGEPVSVDVVIDRRTVAARASELEEPTPGYVYLNLEDIAAEQNPATVYEVFISLPSTPDRAADTPHYIGNVSFFGIEHMSATGSTGDAPHGFRRTFDITARVEQLRAQGMWDDERIVVSLQPVSPIPPPGGELSEADAQELAAAQAVPVRIGRVSLFYG